MKFKKDQIIFILRIVYNIVSDSLLIKSVLITYITTAYYASPG